jgi:hypothetical protein
MSTNLVEVTVPMPTSAASEQARAALAAAEARTILTEQDYLQAGGELTAIKAKAREIDEARKALKKPIDEAAARIQAFFKGPLDFLANAEGVLKRKLVDYQAEQDRKRSEEQARADEAARKERARLQAIADEAARKAREQAAAQRKAAEEAAAAGRAAEAQRLAAAAARTEEKAAEKVETFESRAATVVAPVISREPPKVSGVQTREVWKFEVEDATQVPREYLSVDEAKIRKVVGALKGDTQIAGVRVWAEKAIAAGSAATA